MPSSSARRPRARLHFAADAPTASDGSPPAGPGRGADLEAAVADLARRHAAGLAPLVFSAFGVLAVCEILREDPSTWLFAWTIAATMLVLGTVGVFAFDVVRKRTERPGVPPLVVCGLLALVVLLVYPLAWFDAMPTSLDGRPGLAALAIVAAAAAFAGLPRLSWIPLGVAVGWFGEAVVAAALGQRRALELAIAAAVTALLAWAVRAAARRFQRSMAVEAASASTQLRTIAEARDRAEQADRDKSRFLAIASHDLRQPLHAIGMFAAALENRRRGTSDEPIVADLVQSIEGLSRSFNALMDVSQLDAGSVRPNWQRFPLRDIFRRLQMHFAGQAEAAGLALRFSTGGKSVTSDPLLLERILGNLVQNALKYTVRGGVVVVARSTATHFNVEVWDTGLGISPGELPRVFHEFYQVERHGGVRAQGLGMGLAIVKRLVRLLNHELTVVSQAGRGSMFRVGIPRGSLSDIDDAAVLAADTVPMPLLGRRTALVVDDDEAIRRSLDALLGEWGYRSVGAANHDEASYALRVGESVPDLILCDLNLGEGPDGVAVIRSIRRQCGRPLPAILMTGEASGDEIARAVGTEFVTLSKPVQPRSLRHALRGLEEKA